jgi:hypothetical protein
MSKEEDADKGDVILILTFTCPIRCNPSCQLRRVESLLGEIFSKPLLECENTIKSSH